MFFFFLLFFTRPLFSMKVTDSRMLQERLERQSALRQMTDDLLKNKTIGIKKKYKCSCKNSNHKKTCQLYTSLKCHFCEIDKLLAKNCKSLSVHYVIHHQPQLFESLDSNYRLKEMLFENEISHFKKIESISNNLPYNLYTCNICNFITLSLSSGTKKHLYFHKIGHNQFYDERTEEIWSQSPLNDTSQTVFLDEFEQILQ